MNEIIDASLVLDVNTKYLLELESKPWLTRKKKPVVSYHSGKERVETQQVYSSCRSMIKDLSLLFLILSLPPSLKPFFSLATN